ncbi:MAG: sigma-54-dependent Fis family transcriptional regulator [Calditrichaeota bacterium]|nr:sigma-54-dependent Fis family transcriptional regulator [Calditrichota bacterium]MCB0266692.1 sigma-54-dependent Fis family transcriptional regulator [Calditrichota bacterium]MCB9067264.1 sigma-54-dependent Fis family transcriptional regulator [Calditrichia bacterium]
MTARILIIEDEDLFREDLALLLRRKGFDCHTAATAEEGLERAGAFLPDIILSDIVMPGKSGIDILEDLRSINPGGNVIIMTAFGTLETAIEAFRKGAVDYVLKPPVIEDVLNRIQRILEHQRLLQEIKQLRRDVSEDIASLALVGKSPAMQNALGLIEKVAPTNSIVLITGESGTGKELVARAVHEFSLVNQQPFVAINCAGFQETLLESELFGYVKGAFTGATKDKSGFFETTGEGTLFLDEISEMPPSLQSKLLRVLEQREFYRVGGTTLLPMKARIIAATNKKLKSHIQTGEFREDLYYRIAVFEIDLPPLRERISDIPLLADHFINKFNKELKNRYVGIDPDVLQALMNYEWPGNIRELRNLIERAMILCDGDMLTAEGFPPQVTAKQVFLPLQTKNLKNAVHNFERQFIHQVLSNCNWNKEEAARKMGINPSTLYRKMSDLNVNDPTATEK